MFYRYLSGQKKQLESMTDAIKSPEQQQISYLKELRIELKKLHELGVRRNLTSASPQFSHDVTIQCMHFLPKNFASS